MNNQQWCRIIIYPALCLLLFVSNIRFIYSQSLNDKIVLLIFEINQDTVTNDVQIYIKNTIIKKGKLKVLKHKIQEQSFENDIICSIYDINNKLLYQKNVKNPLMEIVEFLNDDKEFGRDTIYRNKSAFMLRIPYNPDYDKILFNRYVSGRNPVPIETLQLNLLNELH